MASSLLQCHGAGADESGAIDFLLSFHKKRLIEDQATMPLLEQEQLIRNDGAKLTQVFEASHSELLLRPPLLYEHSCYVST